MKLKTLKDIEKISDGSSYERLEKAVCKRIKAEAIKWVKDCKKPVDSTRSDRCGKSLDKFPYNYCCCCQRTIKMNNITKEDLI